MDNAPLFDNISLFSQSRIILADIDGSGTSDIIYYNNNEARVYFNLSGNSWTNPHSIYGCNSLDSTYMVSAFDLMGDGTACLVWSTQTPGESGQRIRYIRLMSQGKPHLLKKTVNNLGSETGIEYSTSNKFYLQDLYNDKPWITGLSFPVHVVERVKTKDRISRNRFIKRYSYHHGYFNGYEREFNGFGMVEEFDTEHFEILEQEENGSSNIEDTSHVPPVLTKTWFHPGAPLEEVRGISDFFKQEYYKEPGSDEGVLLPDTILPSNITHEDGTKTEVTLCENEIREACRSLKGRVLRKEVYGLDGSESESTPYSVNEQNLTVNMLQPQLEQRHAVFFVHEREQIDLNYERKEYSVNGTSIMDPRVIHSSVLESDTFGNIKKQATVSYGRRFPDNTLTSEEQEIQSETKVTLVKNEHTNSINEIYAYRTPVLSERSEYQLYNLPEIPGDSRVFSFDVMRGFADNLSDETFNLEYTDINGEGVDESSQEIYHSCIEKDRTLYRKDDLTGLLPLGSLESLGIIGQKYKLSYPDSVLNNVYIDPGKLSEPEIQTILSDEGGYVSTQELSDQGLFPDEYPVGFWIPSSRIYYSTDSSDTPSDELSYAVSHYFTPHRYVDPFEHETTIKYDPYDLNVIETQDPVGNLVTVGEREDDGSITPGINYRVMKPELTTDPNGNRESVVFDAMGMVVGTAVMGKKGESKGDLLTGFNPDLSDAEIQDHIENPLSDPHQVLNQASTRLIYDLYAYQNTQDQEHPQPCVVYTITRETHASELGPSEVTGVQHGFAYSDGFGRVIQDKKIAEPGPIDSGGSDVSPRWRATGWKVFNNKGNPVKKFEPFFTETHEFEFSREEGVSPVLMYDALERLSAVLHPNHTWEKRVYEPWKMGLWDVNDTVLIDPSQDIDVSGYFTRLPDSDYLPTWYDQRIDGSMGSLEQAAAQKSEPHSSTPVIEHKDPLGRSFLSVAHNRAGDGSNLFYKTRNRFDIEGNVLEQIDAKGRVVIEGSFSMMSNRVYTKGMETGERRLLIDVQGNPLRSWDSRNHVFRETFDELRRPLEFFVKGHDTNNPETEICYEKRVYGESLSSPEDNNLREKVYKLYDSSGITENSIYDFKGNLLSGKKLFTQDYVSIPDWNGYPLTETEEFVTQTTWDAMNRVVTMTTPDSSVSKPVYNQAGHLESLYVDIRGGGTDTEFVTNIDYDAKSRRLCIEYGNDSVTDYSYDSETFRLIRLMTKNSTGSDIFQDLNYVYDPIGNVASITDNAQQTLYYNNQVVEPHTEYTYDALYRVIEAKGREHEGQQSSPAPQWNDEYRTNLPHPNDGQAMQRYTESYSYDSVGNILSMIHQANNGNWTRDYTYTEQSSIDPLNYSNSLTSTSIGSDTFTYTHDIHGSMNSMPHLIEMRRDFLDRLTYLDLQGGGDTYYNYDSSGQRIRKVREKGSGIIEKRYYLGGFEVFRREDGTGIITLERETLHISDDTGDIALVETMTQGDDGSPEQVIRYQYTNHLGSAALELDDTCSIISYEEYYPFGSTSYQAVNSSIQVPRKRYRYTGKERDEESGLYYYGARYYVSWLGRWCSCDPSVQDGLNLYVYVRNNPVRKVDSEGRQSNDALDKKPKMKTIEEQEDSYDRTVKKETDKIKEQSRLMLERDEGKVSMKFRYMKYNKETGEVLEKISIKEEDVSDFIGDKKLSEVDPEQLVRDVLESAEETGGELAQKEHKEVLYIPREPEITEYVSGVDSGGKEESLVQNDIEPDSSDDSENLGRDLAVSAGSASGEKLAPKVAKRLQEREVGKTLNKLVKKSDMSGKTTAKQAKIVSKGSKAVSRIGKIGKFLSKAFKWGGIAIAAITGIVEAVNHFSKNETAHGLLDLAVTGMAIGLGLAIATPTIGAALVFGLAIGLFSWGVTIFFEDLIFPGLDWQ